MLSLLCCLIFVLGQPLTSGQSLELGSADQYMEDVIRTALPEVFSLEIIEPIYLPDFDFEFNDNILGRNKGRVEYKQGHLMGLQMVHRYSDCDGPKNTTDGITVINCTLTFNGPMGGNLMVIYGGEIIFENNPLHPNMHISGHAEIHDLILRVGIAKGTSDSNARLDSFGFISLGSANIPMDQGLMMIKQRKTIEDNYKVRILAEAVNAVNDRFRYGLKLAVAKVVMPLE